MDRPNTIPWPPLLYAAALLVGYGLHVLMPLPWPGGFAGEFAFMAGLLMSVMAIFIDIRTFLELRKHNTTVLPTKSARHLVTSGPFAMSRNPIYLANTMLVIGIGLVFGVAWMFFTAIGAAIATNHLAILREEAHLERLFGSQYRQYKKKARRWI